MPMHKDESARDTTLFRHFLTKMTSLAEISAHALTGAPDFPFGSNSRIASHPALDCLAPPDSSLNELKNATYSSQRFSYTNMISKNELFVNRFGKTNFGHFNHKTSQLDEINVYFSYIYI